MINLDSLRLRAARALIKEAAKHLQSDLSVELWNGEILPLGPNARSDVRAVVRSPGAVRQMLRKPGVMTVFELYADGQLDVVGGTPLEASRRLDHSRSLRLKKNIKRSTVIKCALPFLLGGKPAKAVSGFEGEVQSDAQRGRADKQFIQFHYDVSNAFYALFLDPEMVYSCGYFATRDVSLEDAQIAKLDRICQKLRLKPGDRLLDIGCGWGGLICHAAANYSAVCHGVTLSQSQFDFAAAKIARLGLGDKIKLELKDYRAIDPGARYDKIAQVEMFEHVGLDNHDKHFEWIRQLLEPRGLYFHQASTRVATKDPAKFRQLTGYMKVITRHIFPGGEMDHIGMTATNLERHGFEVHDIEGLREHFQATLEHWVARLHARREEAIAEIGPQKTRMWLLYLTMCARGFERGGINLFQVVASNRRAGSAGLPLVRV